MLMKIIYLVCEYIMDILGVDADNCRVMKCNMEMMVHFNFFLSHKIVVGFWDVIFSQG